MLRKLVWLLDAGLAAIKAGHVRDGADVVQELRVRYFDDKV